MAHPLTIPVQPARTIKRTEPSFWDMDFYLGTCGIWNHFKQGGQFVGTGSLVQYYTHFGEKIVHLITSDKVISSDDLSCYSLHFKKSRNKNISTGLITIASRQTVIFDSGLAIVLVDPRKFSSFRRSKTGLLNRRPITICTLSKEDLRESELHCLVVEEVREPFAIKLYQVMGIADEETYLTDRLDCKKMVGTSLDSIYCTGPGAPIYTSVEGRAVVVGALTIQKYEPISFVLFSQIDCTRAFPGLNSLLGAGHWKNSGDEKASIVVERQGREEQQPPEKQALLIPGERLFSDYDEETSLKYQVKQLRNDVNDVKEKVVSIASLLEDKGKPDQHDSVKFTFNGCLVSVEFPRETEKQATENSWYTWKSGERGWSEPVFAKIKESSLSPLMIDEENDSGSLKKPILVSPETEEQSGEDESESSEKTLNEGLEAEKLVDLKDIQPERELIKSTSKESEEAEKLLGQQDKPEGELTESTTKECEGSVESIAQLGQIQLDSSKVNDKTDLKVELKKIASDKGFRIVDNEGSGNCMFYALSDQLEIAMGFKIRHEELRRILVQYLSKNPKLPDETNLFYFVDGYHSWADYLTYMEQDGAWGDHVILCAAANCYKTCIHVVSSLSADHDVILRPQCPVENSRTLMLGHIHEVHYVSLHSAQEAEKLVGQQNLQSESEPTKGASKESEEAEKLVGQQDIQPESELTKGRSKKSEEAQQQPQYRDIIEKTKEFETYHKECIRVLPYIDEVSGQVYVQLYVFCGKNGIPTELREAARKHFEVMGVELKWRDLCDGTSDVPNFTPGVSRRLEKSEVDEISKIIDTSLLTFSKHRNITAVYPSLKVTDSKRTNEPCIMVNVIGKGRIPIGETNIPKFVELFPVDIVEGFWIETETPSKPIEPQDEQREYLRLGASIGIKGVPGAGTLGAILEDQDGNYYLLSCDHVIRGVDTQEIIHPGRQHYLDSLEYYLNEYNKLLKRITDSKTNFFPRQQPTEDEMLATFRELQRKSDKYNYGQLHSSLKTSGCYKQFNECGQKLEELFKHPPRVIADFSYGFCGHVRKRSSHYETEICIDAAIAKLKDEESAALKKNYFVEMIGTADYPSGNVIGSDEVQCSEGEWCKSGSATGYTRIKSSFVPIYLSPPLTRAPVLYFDLRTNERSEKSELIVWQKCLLLENKERTFSYHSDSGAVIFKKFDGEESMSGIGIVTAGQYMNDKLSGTIMSPLDIALEILSLGLKKKLQIVSKYEHETFLKKNTGF